MRTTPKQNGAVAGNDHPVSVDTEALKQAQNRYQTESVPSTATVTTFPRRRQTLRRRAAIRLAELYRLALFRRHHGLTVDPNTFAFTLAATLECGRPGTMLIRGRVNRETRQEARPQEIRWPGLTMNSLREAISRADLGAFSDAELWTLIEAVERFTGENGLTLIGAAKLGEMLQLTSAERQECRLRSIDAVDEPRAERQARLREERRQRDREEKRAKRGRVQRAIYEATSTERKRPWEAAGVSRASWYRKRRETGVSADDIYTTRSATHLSHGVAPLSIHIGQGSARPGGADRGVGADGHAPRGRTIEAEASRSGSAAAGGWWGGEVIAFPPRPRAADPGEPSLPELTGRTAQVVGLIEAAGEALGILVEHVPPDVQEAITRTVGCLDGMVDLLWMAFEASHGAADETAISVAHAAAEVIFSLGANDNRTMALAERLAA